jgi:hypothetical protein
LHGFKLILACACIQICSAVWETFLLSMPHTDIESPQLLVSNILYCSILLH